MSTLPRPLLRCVDKAAWTAWLASNHDRSSGLWLVIAKAGSRSSSVTYAEAVEGALCYGWIDGQKKTHTASAWLQRFSPRGKRSTWSKINRDKALKLVERGEMKAPGQAEIDRAKKDGRWDAAYDPPSKAKVPDDFQAALDRNRKAREFWSKVNSATRYAVLFRIHASRKAETRARNIERFVAMLERGETLY